MFNDDLCIKAKLYTCTDCHGGQQQISAMGNVGSWIDNNILRLDLNDGTNLYELTIPTCSYRMGVPQMGFGAAVIGKLKLFALICIYCLFDISFHRTRLQYYCS